MKIPKPTVNFYKVLVGVGFSLLWASLMYRIWDQPSYLIFVLFYLGLGSVVLKWVIFEVIDRASLRLRLRRVKKELEESRARVEDARPGTVWTGDQPLVCNSMTKEGLQDELSEVKTQVSALARMVEEAMEMALGSLNNRNMSLARQVIEHDHELDLKQTTIRDYCMQVIASTCPKAEDLSMIMAVLGVVVDLERMGDYAEGIAKITLMLGNRPHLAAPREVNLMAEKGILMLRRSIEAFLTRDVEKARGIVKMDDEVDALHDRVFRDLIRLMIENPKLVTQATWLVWVSHNLERFGDRVTNICEWVFFSAGSEPVNPPTVAAK